MRLVNMLAKHERLGEKLSLSINYFKPLPDTNKQEYTRFKCQNCLIFLDRLAPWSFVQAQQFNFVQL